MYPIQAVRSQRGRMVVEWFMRMGYIGPRRRPTNETAMAFSMSDGTTQTVTSMLMTRINLQLMRYKWMTGSQYGEQRI